MKKLILMLLALMIAAAPCVAKDKSTTTRKERRAIMAGNKLYKQSKFSEAAAQYRLALKENGGSVVATYNLGLTQLRLAAAPGVKEEDSKKYEQQGVSAMQSVEKAGAEHPLLASRAAYNMGNVAFNAQDFQSALNSYKQALRFDPANNDARRNLRITQLKLQNQNKDNKDNKDKNKDQNKDQNKDKDKEKDKNQDQNQDQNKDQNKDQQPPKQQPDNQISEQTADQILKAMENKEAQTRARVMNPQKQNKSNSRTSGRKNW